MKIREVVNLSKVNTNIKQDYVDMYINLAF